jgi:hypothetical protein
MTRGRALSLSLALLLGLGNSGCVLAALIDAGGRELNDHGDYARYENKSYGHHFADSLFESDDDDDDCD